MIGQQQQLHLNSSYVFGSNQLLNRALRENASIFLAVMTALGR